MMSRPAASLARGAVRLGVARAGLWALLVMSARAPAASTSHVATSERSDDPSTEQSTLDKVDDREDVEVAGQEPPVYSERAREVWRAAAQSSDWEEVVRRIDGLPEA